MRLLKRLKNVFTDELVNGADLIKDLQDNGLLLTWDKTEPAKEVVHSWSIDWSKLGVPVSVERLFETCDDEERTIIGYWPTEGHKTDDEIQEWTMFITRDQHEDLVKEFNKYIGKEA